MTVPGGGSDHAVTKRGAGNGSDGHTGATRAHFEAWKADRRAEFRCSCVTCYLAHLNAVDDEAAARTVRERDAADTGKRLTLGELIGQLKEVGADV